MANTTTKYIKYDGQPILVDFARRDDGGNSITATYATKAELTLKESALNLAITNETNRATGIESGLRNDLTSLQTTVSTKQDTLVSGTNIKTVNGQTILGSGDLSIEIPRVTIDAELNDTSTNPVQNKVINAALATKQNVLSAGSNISISGTTISATVPTNISQLTNDSGYITSTALAPYLLTSNFTWANMPDKPTLSTVATSGSYNDLTDKPAIPSLSGYATETWVKSNPKYTISLSGSTLTITTNY